MKRISVLFILVFVCSGLLVADSNLLRQETSRFFEVSLSTSSTHTVSSYTVVTAEDLARTGVIRQFAIDGACDGTVYYQYGGSTTTVASVGIPMEESGKLYVESNYYGDIYFQTDTSTATLRLLEITRKAA